MKELFELALKEASKSKGKKRKVGAVIVDKEDMIIGLGHNYHPNNEELEDVYGNTKPEVVHAEVAAIDNAIESAKILEGSTIFVTHQPCENCRKAIENAGIVETIIVTEFMKFDTGKLRYSLIPPSALKGLASVLTYGAKKYKPNNWRQVDDLERYIDALYRHLEAYRAGEIFDSESGLKHLEHALTNIAFLLELDNNQKRP